MSSLVLNVTFDCRDAGAVAQFWEAVTGHRKEHVHQPGNDHWVVSPPDNSVSRIDPATNELVATVPVGRSPSGSGGHRAR